jgi:Flp pilus assembly protein TadG
MVRGFLHDRRGAAAVEFAVLVPLFSALLIGLMLAWEPATAMLRMRAAVHAGATYVRDGGTDDALTYSAVEKSWQRKPSDAVIAVSRSCLCGAAVHACTSTCSDSTPPSVYVTITASDTDMSRAFGKTLGRSEVVRVR